MQGKPNRELICGYHNEGTGEMRYTNSTEQSCKRTIRACRKYKGTGIRQGNVMPERVRLTLSIPLKMSVSSDIGHLKEHANLKYQYRNRHF